ncbi:MAG: hypothetical protein ACI7YS_17780 [Flavobacterium sp.]
MNEDYYNRIANSSALRESRVNNKSYTLSNPEYLSDLIQMAFDTKDKNHHKACWVLELVCEEQPELLLPYLDKFCEVLTKYTREQALRPIAKICMLAAKKLKTHLTEIQEEKIVSACFDWLIGKHKVAPKVYAIYTLNSFAKKNDWIRQELLNIIEKDFSEQSAAYKAAAKEVLRKLSK